MTDFWRRHSVGYRLFSSFCDIDDWMAILRKTAQDMQSHSSGNALNFLDIGAGTGVNSDILMRMLSMRNGARHLLTAVEPSHVATRRLLQTCVSHADGGCLREHFYDWRDIGRKKFDAVLFLHSTYYVEDLSEVLERLLMHNLRDRAPIVIAALSRRSPMFFGKQPWLPHTAEDILAILKRLGAKQSHAWLPSRFRLPATTRLGNTAMGHLHKFIADGSTLSLEDFGPLFDAHMREGTVGEGVDLKDVIIRAVR